MLQFLFLSCLLPNCAAIISGVMGLRPVMMNREGKCLAELVFAQISRVFGADDESMSERVLAESFRIRDAEASW